MLVQTITHVLILLVFPLLMMGIINRVKSWFAGRVGPPLLQPYYDVFKLLKKGAVYSRTTTWIFRAGPIVSLAAILTAGLLSPLASVASPLGFVGDIVVFAYLLGLSRFITMAAALDTGSSFEGMGASREGAFAAFTEPALFFALAIVCVPVMNPSFQAAWQFLPRSPLGLSHTEYIAAAAVLFVVLLVECSRIPVDDPNTHLELTMIHEVMVLDHSGPDFAFILYGSAIKFFLISALLVRLILPFQGGPLWEGVVMILLGEAGIAVLVGVVESMMARLRLSRVPQFLIGASVVGVIGLAVAFYRGR